MAFLHADHLAQLLVRQRSGRFGAVEAFLCGDIEQDFGLPDLAPMVEMGGKQRQLQPGLRLGPCRCQRPAEQLVRQEGVPHHRRRFGRFAARIIEADAGFFRHRAHVPLHVARLFQRAAVFPGDMRCALLAFLRHVGVQLERAPADLGVDFALKGLQRARQLAPADKAPGAHDIGPDVDGDPLAHRSSHQSMRVRAMAKGRG